MPKKFLGRTLTISSDQKEKDKENNNQRTNKLLLTRQLSSLEGGSCPNSPQVKKAFRLVVLGSSQTGKSSVVNRFLTDTFDDCYVPTIENFHRKLYRIHGEFYQLDILDTSGNDPFPAARRLSLLTGDLFLLVCSMDKLGSYEKIFHLRDQIIDAKNPDDGPSAISAMAQADYQKRSASIVSSQSYSNFRIPIAIAANKIDLPPSKHAFNLDEARTIFTTFAHCVFVECSAKTGANVDELFSKLFALAKLPKQMAPGLHRRVGLEKSVDSATSTASDPVPGPSGNRRFSRGPSLRRLRSKHNEPALAYEAEVRRPSLRTDLMLLRAKQSSHLLMSPSSVNSMPNSLLKEKSKNGRKTKCVLM